MFLASLLASAVGNSYLGVYVFFVLWKMTLITMTSSPLSLLRFYLSRLLSSLSRSSFLTPTKLAVALAPAAALPPLPLLMGESVASLLQGGSFLQIFALLPPPDSLLALLASSSSLDYVVSAAASSRAFPLANDNAGPTLLQIADLILE